MDFEPDTLPIDEWVAGMPDKQRIKELEAELAALREAVEKIKVVERIVRGTHGTPVKLGRAIDEAASLLQERGE